MCLIFFKILCLLLLLHNRSHGVRSSGLQFLFWFMLTICNLPQLRTEIINQNAGENKNNLLFVNYIFYSLLVLFMLISNCFADKPSSTTPSVSSFSLLHIHMYNKSQKNPFNSILYW